MITLLGFISASLEELAGNDEDVVQLSLFPDYDDDLSFHVLIARDGTQNILFSLQRKTDIWTLEWIIITVNVANCKKYLSLPLSENVIMGSNIQDG